jgi:hypothetical protein
MMRGWFWTGVFLSSSFFAAVAEAGSRDDLYYHTARGTQTIARHPTLLVMELKPI